jgi:uncharacterized protein (UPF0147 family)
MAKTKPNKSKSYKENIKYLNRIIDSPNMPTMTRIGAMLAKKKLKKKHKSKSKK